MIDVMMILFHDFRKFVYLKNVAQKFDKINYYNSSHKKLLITNYLITNQSVELLFTGNNILAMCV